MPWITLEKVTTNAGLGFLDDAFLDDPFLEGEGGEWVKIVKVEDV